MSGPGVGVPDQQGTNGAIVRKKRRFLIVAAVAIAAAVAAGAGIGLAASQGADDKNNYGYLPADTTPRTLTCSPQTNPQAISNLTSVELRKNDSTGIAIAVKFSDQRALAIMAGEQTRLRTYMNRGVDTTGFLEHTVQTGLVLDYSKDPAFDTSADGLPRPANVDSLEVLLPLGATDDLADADFLVGTKAGGDEEEPYSGKALVEPSGEVVLSIPPSAMGNFPLGKRPALTAASREVLLVHGAVGQDFVRAYDRRYESVQECREAGDAGRASMSTATSTASVAAPTSVPVDDADGSVDPEATLMSLLERHGIPAPDGMVAHLSGNGLANKYCIQLETGTGMPPESSSSASARWKWVAGGLGQSVKYLYGESHPNIVNESTANQILRDIAAAYCPDQVP